MSEKKMSLVSKLAQVMAHVQYIQKRGKNNFHGYKYATESDVSDAIRDQLAQRNIMLIPSVLEVSQRDITTAKGKPETISKTRINYTFYDGDSEETISFTMEGEGQDPGDKGVYKAITGTTKYALMKGFLVPTGDDPEADAGVDERGRTAQPIGEDQIAAIRSLIGEVSADETKFLGYMGLERLEDMPASSYQSAVAALEKKRKAA